MIINLNDLPRLRERYKDKKIVFCSGSFDLTHAGHVLFFEDCKKHGDILVVAVGADAIVSSNRKDPNRPILNQYLRSKTVDSFKPVDYVLIDEISNSKNPLLLLDVMFEKLRPDIYVINEDAFDIHYREKISKQFGIKLVILGRDSPEEFKGISTTKIIEKIKNLKD